MAAKKTLKISLIVIASVLLILAISLGIYCLIMDQLKFDHKDCTEIGISEGKARENYSITYPFFANSALLNDDGPYYSDTIFGGSKNIWIYEGINGIIFLWTNHLSERFDGCDIGYDLEQTDKLITVNFSGTVNNSENDVSYEQKFVFDIENPTSDNPPEWINIDEAEDGFREYYEYMTDPANSPKPKWAM